MKLVDMNWMEVQAAAQQNVPVLIPAGAIQQHGPFLPIGTDVFIPQEICDRSAENIGGLSLPPISLSYVERRYYKPGTISVSIETSRAVARETVQNVISWGFGDIFILNGHDENRMIIDSICEELSLQNPGTRIIVGEWWEVAWDRVRTILDSNKDELGIACEDETSVLLCLKPELVRKNRIRDSPTCSARYRSFPVEKAIEVQGRPSSATADKGRRLLETIVDEVCSICKKEFPLNGRPQSPLSSEAIQAPQH